jgi:putative hydroxymethylpyrimidine transport system substrate-binding protein
MLSLLHRILRPLALLALLWLPVAAQAQQPPAEKLTVLLDWFTNPDHAPLLIAREKGYFREAGLDVTLIEPADPATPPRLVAAGQADIAVSYQPTFMLGVKEGLPLTRLGTLVATPLNSLVVLADGPVKTLADLKGRTVGYSGTGFDDLLLRTMMKTVGLSDKDVTLVNINFALTVSLVSGRVDAVVGAFRNFELTELELVGKKGRAFFPEEHGVPTYDELIYVVKSERMGEPRMRRFLDAIERATVFLLNNPAESLELMVKANPKLGDTLNRRAFADTLPRFQASPAAVDPERYRRFGAFLQAAGMIDRVEPMERYLGR